jgi:hypothetical protein
VRWLRRLLACVVSRQQLALGGAAVLTGFKGSSQRCRVELPWVNQSDGKSDRAFRPRMYSPGRPPVARREDRQRFWAAIAKGLTTEDAGAGAGNSPAVGACWFGQSGGMPPVTHPRLRAGICPTSSERKSRSRARLAVVYARSPRASIARHRRSRGNCVGTPPPAAAPWITEP